MEMQAVARKVAKENTLLRSLLRKSGITDIAITDYLLDNRDKAEPTSYVTNPATNKPFQQPMPRKIHIQSGSQPSEALIETIVPTGLEKHLHLASTTTTEPSAQFRPRELVGLPHLLSETTLSTNEPSRSHLDYDKSPGVGSKESSRSNATSCETAAKIIVSMRGYGDIKETQSEFGCAVTPGCMISNVEIFKMMD